MACGCVCVCVCMHMCVDGVCVHDHEWVGRKRKTNKHGDSQVQVEALKRCYFKDLWPVLWSTFLHITLQGLIAGNHMVSMAAPWPTYHSLEASSVEVLAPIVPDDVGSIAETGRTPVLDLCHFALVTRPT